MRIVHAVFEQLAGEHSLVPVRLDAAPLADPLRIDAGHVVDFVRCAVRAVAAADPLLFLEPGFEVLHFFDELLVGRHQVRPVFGRSTLDESHLGRATGP
ncbi:hypothetical protein FQZ97_964250 [compost metagenome]